MTDTMQHLNELFRGVFDDEDLVITRETSARDIDDWDSLMHVTLLLTVEKGFGIRFSSSQVAGLTDVGQLVDLIEDKQTE